MWTSISMQQSRNWGRNWVFSRKTNNLIYDVGLLQGLGKQVVITNEQLRIYAVFYWGKYTPLLPKSGAQMLITADYIGCVQPAENFVS